MQATYNSWLREDIGFNSNVRVTHVRGLGLDNFERLLDFDREDIKTLCNAARKEAPPFQISVVIEKYLKNAVFAAKIYRMIGRTLTREAFTVPRLRKFQALYDSLKSHKDTTSDVTKISKTFKIDKALDSFPTLLRDRLGIRYIPLSYVIRADDQRKPLSALAPGEIHGVETESIYDELINSSLLEGEEYLEDRAAVYNILSDMIAESTHTSSLKGFMRARDGRGAFQALVTHNLGQSQWDKIISRAESVMTQREWNGRNHRFTMNYHCTMHRDAYNDLVRATEFTTYQLPDERTRVTRLLASIKAEHIASIASAKCTIENDSEKRINFEEAADFLCLMAPKNRSNNRDIRNISSLTVDQKQELDELSLIDVGSKDRFYKPHEYRQLTNDQKRKLWLLRQQRGGNTSGARGNRSSSSLKKKLKQASNELKDAKRKIAALEQKEDDESIGGDGNPIEGKGGERGRVRFNQKS